MVKIRAVEHRWVCSSSGMSFPLQSDRSVHFPFPETHQFFHDATVHDDLEILFPGKTEPFFAPDSFLDPDAPDAFGSGLPDDRGNVGRFAEYDDQIRDFRQAFKRGMAPDMPNGLQDGIDRDHRKTMVLEVT